MVDGQCSLFPLRDVLVANIKLALSLHTQDGQILGGFFSSLSQAKGNQPMKNEDKKADKMSNGSKMMSV